MVHLYDNPLQAIINAEKDGTLDAKLEEWFDALTDEERARQRSVTTPSRTGSHLLSHVAHRIDTLYLQRRKKRSTRQTTERSDGRRRAT